MRFRLYREYGALNSGPIFDAFERGLMSLGHEIASDTDSIPVIWSVLWAGRMASNKIIYDQAIKNKKPVIIIEVGNLLRNRTWRLSINHINGQGEFSNDTELDATRPKKLNIFLKSPLEKRQDEILIAAQHQKSLQWAGMPTMNVWVADTIKEIRKYSDRKIIVRPHPRSPFSLNIPEITVETPKLIPASYDDFNINYNYHCVVNHNSGPAVQAAINGVPIICHASSLASELSDTFQNIENIRLPNREDWFLKLCHTEWTVQEIESGYPINRLLKKIS